MPIPTSSRAVSKPNLRMGTPHVRNILKMTAWEFIDLYRSYKTLRNRCWENLKHEQTTACCMSQHNGLVR